MMEKARKMVTTLFAANRQVEKLGFIAEGEIFLDAGIEHIRVISRE
jgi:predicted GNAT family N-acyltransferase